MHRFQALTNWTAGKQPQLALDHVLIECSDITAQPQENVMPEPNLYTIEGVCSDAVLTALVSDPDVYVLWSDEIEEA